MSASSYSAMTPPFAMGPSTGNFGNMPTMRQDSMGKSYEMRISPLSLSLVPIPTDVENSRAVPMGEEDWYNKSLSALRMNTSNPHSNLPSPMLQYQT